MVSPLYLASLLAVFLLLGLRADKTSAQVCGENLGGYDFMSLTKQSSWIFQVPPSDCIQFPGLEILDCQVEFAICKDLDVEICGESSAVCMSILTNDTDFPVLSVSLGQSSESSSRPLPPGSGEGFVYNFSNGDSFSGCTTNAEILMVFQCDESASWDYKNPAHYNVTQFVELFELVGDCVFVAVLNYSGACLRKIPIEPYNCDLPGYDLATLANATAWFATPPPETCYFPDGFTPIGGSPCTLYFSFCKPLLAGTCYNSVFCESIVPSGPIVALSFGTYDPNITAQATEEPEGFVLQYKGGSKTDNCPRGLISTVSFICNKSAIWPGMVNGNVTEYMTAAADEAFCQYVVAFQYSGACRTTSTSSVSFVGWILMAVVIGIALIYLVTGLVVQYVRGRRGIELIPNIEFWKLFFLPFQNVGYQTLQKAGWTEGSQGTGVTAPINKDKQSFDQTGGVGAAHPGEVTKDDDTSDDTYCERTMLA